MDNQTRNHLNLQKHIADQDHIIRVRNAEIAALRKRAEKAEKERDSWESIAQQTARSIDALRAEQPRTLTADDITDEMIQRMVDVYQRYTGRSLAGWIAKGILTASLTEPTRPEGAEKVEAVLHQYWSGDINGDDLADRIAEEMNR